LFLCFRNFLPVTFSFDVFGEGVFLLLHGR
jgi:hypothetical protein